MPTLLSHFQKLLAYDIWATAKVLEALETIPPANRTGPDYDRLIGLTPHNLTALRIWHWRITAEPYNSPKDWFPKLTTAETAALAAAVHAQWSTYLATLTDPDLSKEFDYTTSDGTPRHGSTADAITHAFNHATYHRGQIARITHQLGGTRPATDFFLFTVSTS